MDTANGDDRPAAASPLGTPAFRALWLATVVSNIGTWMHDVGAGWLMTSLSPEPLLVALVQAATTLPMFLFALPGGALADIVDRRRLLIGLQACGLLAAALLAGLTWRGVTDPVLLLAITFTLASATALGAPAFQAIVPELVPPVLLPQAVALNSLGVNVARAIGPALGGVVIAAAGPAAVFALNAVSVLGILSVLARWRAVPRTATLPAEHFFGALRTGARYARHSPALQAVLVRSIGFFLFSSALWALLPLLARRDLGVGPAGYGGLLAFFGIGAIAGAVALPAVRRRVGTNAVMLAASLLFAAAMVALPRAGRFAPAAATMAFAGAGWIAMVSTLNTTAQLAAPAWVKARALAIYLVAFQGALAAGAALWGVTATLTSLTTTLTIAAVGVAAGLALASRFPIGHDASPDLAASRHWATPHAAPEVMRDHGPVSIQVEYRIDPGRRPAFVDAMQSLRRIRRRDGALSWGLFEDAAEPGRMLETFLVTSWLEHLRQHDRVTNADRAEQQVVLGFHVPDAPPVVRHLIAR